MNLQGKRLDAAHTLVVPYDATPADVRLAYEKRVSQKLFLTDMDFASFLRGQQRLYDARVRMSFSPSRQWLAALKLALASRSDKSTSILLACLRSVRGSCNSLAQRFVITSLIENTHSLCRKYNLYRGMCAYEVLGLAAMTVHNTVGQVHNNVIETAVYGSLLAVCIGMGCVKASINRSYKKIDSMTKLLGAIRSVSQK